jgi:putative hydroxymethylpyrimidine transport system permease protein
MKKIKNKIRDFLRSFFHAFILILGFLLIWQGLVSGLGLPNFLLPGPLLIAEEIIENKFLLWREFWPTALETLIGFFLAMIWGVLIALLMRFSRVARYWILPIIVVSQAIPTFAIAPFLVIWFGYGMSSKIAVTVFALFFPITVAFYDGLRRISSDWLALATVMKARPLLRLWVLEIPSALPGLASGLRVAAAWAPMAAIIGEWVGSSRGLGFLMLNANAQADTPLMFSALVILVIFSLLLYYCVDLGLKKWIFWENK